jgi:hypothetical protein
MLSREAVAVTLALAGVRSGAQVLDLAPAAGLTRAARAAAGPTGRVVSAGESIDPAIPAPRYGHAIGVWPGQSADSVLDSAEQARPALASSARVTLGTAGSLVALSSGLREAGWTIVHGTTVAEADPDLGADSQLALVVARPPHQPDPPTAHS